MTFKILRRNRGSALVVALILAVLILIGGVALMTRSFQRSRLAKRNTNESRALVTAHGLSSLLKQDLLTNYGKFQTDAAWLPCRGATPATVDRFMQILDDPSHGATPATCPNVVFAFDYFQTLDAVPSSNVALSLLKTTRVKPKAAFELNGFKLEFALSDYNLNSSRNTVSSAATLATVSPKEMPVNKILRMVIDVKRTVSSPSAGSECSICRTVPGAVCCDGEVNIAYLENGSGRILDVLFDEESQTIVDLKPTPTEVGKENPRAVSVRLEPARKDYDEASFCIPSLDATYAVRYVVDTAKDESGNEYFLTTHGKILKNGAEIAVDEKLASIAYDGGKWFLLRSDGQVLRTTNIADPLSYAPIEGLRLPTASRLVMGEGSTKTCSP